MVGHMGAAVILELATGRGHAVHTLVLQHLVLLNRRLDLGLLRMSLHKVLLLRSMILSHRVCLLHREGECVVEANELRLGGAQGFKTDDDARATLGTQVPLELDSGYLRRMLGVFANTR